MSHPQKPALFQRSFFVHYCFVFYLFSFLILSSYINLNAKNYHILFNISVLFFFSDLIFQNLTHRFSSPM